MSHRIGVAQLNWVVGDIAGNCQQIEQAAQRAHAQGLDLLLTPEMALCGYPAEDLWLRPSFVTACHDAMLALAAASAQWQGLTLVLGTPLRQNGALLNAAVVIRDGQVQAHYAKQALPNYDVFDEQRYFEAGSTPLVWALPSRQGGEPVQVAVLICEDAWVDAPAQQAVAAGGQLLLVLNASPMHHGKMQTREAVMQARAQAVGVPLVYAHLVGGQDELVFEGASFSVNPQGLASRAAAFRTELHEVEATLTPQGVVLAGAVATPPDDEAQWWHALVLAVRDYVEKNGFPSVILGLSGGIDSALVMAVAVDALGPERVHAVMMPSPYTADISWLDARDMAQRLGVTYHELAIAPLFEGFTQTLAPLMAGRAPDTTEENLQARIRGTLLMALSNKMGHLVLTTGNKSEMATGYCTLYGDMAGGFAVIKDLLKTQVFKLAWWRNAHDPYGRGSNPIPERIITRPPSAELRPDQTDQDSLPPYEVLDALIHAYMVEQCSPEQLKAQGFASEVVDKVVRLIRLNEYKRRQAPPGPRLSARAFGRDWRMPITNRYHS